MTRNITRGAQATVADGRTALAWLAAALTALAVLAPTHLLSTLNAVVPLVAAVALGALTRQVILTASQARRRG